MFYSYSFNQINATLVSMLIYNNIATVK